MYTQMPPSSSWGRGLFHAQIGARVVLGDRLVSTTLARTWAALSAWQKVRFVSELLLTGFSVPSEEIEKLLSNMEVSSTCRPDIPCTSWLLLPPAPSTSSKVRRIRHPGIEGHAWAAEILHS